MSLHLEKADIVDKKLQLIKDIMKKLSQNSDPSASLHLVLELLDKHLLVNSPVQLLQEKGVLPLNGGRIFSSNFSLVVFSPLPLPSFFLVICFFIYSFEIGSCYVALSDL